MSLIKTRRKAIKDLLQAGEYEDAVKRALEWGFTIGPEGVVLKVPQPPLPVIAPKPLEDTPPLWPAEDNAVVVHRPLNNRMLGVELSDGRRVNMWKTGGHSHPIGAKVRVKLYEMVGPEPYYEASSSS